MVDYFSLAVSHAVLLLAFWRLMQRDDLDAEPSRDEACDAEQPGPDPEPRKGRLRRA
jgi:hypothetical protein